MVASLNLLHSSLTFVASPQGYREGLILPSKHLVGDHTTQWSLAWESPGREQRGPPRPARRAGPLAALMAPKGAQPAPLPPAHSPELCLPFQRTLGNY